MSFYEEPYYLGVYIKSLDFGKLPYKLVHDVLNNIEHQENIPDQRDRSHTSCARIMSHNGILMNE